VQLNLSYYKKNVFWCLEGKELIKKGLLPKKKILQEKEDFFLMQRIFFSYQTLGFVVME